MRGQAPAQASLTVLSREGRRTVPLTISGDQDLVFLDDLASLFQLSVREDSLGALTVGYKGKTILMTPDQPIASIAGRLISLPAAPSRAGRRWLVPVEFVGRALALVYDARLDLRRASRLLVVGDLRVPRVTVRVENGDPTRVVIDASPRTGSTIAQENRAIAVRFEADALDLVVPGIQPGPELQAIRLQEPAALLLEPGPRFGAFRASTQPLETATRLTIDLQSAPGPAPTGPPAATAAAPPPAAAAPAPDRPLPAALPAAGQGTLVLDPGHGGDDDGVRGAAGTREKDLALAVARRVKAAVEARLGIRVVLTRDDDRAVPLETRAAIANNNKADLFLSLHANASFRRTAAGASFFYASFEPEVEAAGAMRRSERVPTLGGGFREIELVSWDTAQLRYVARSADLARMLADEFRDRIPLSPHPVERAPIEVLRSANMPAVMVEMGYLSNDDQERLLADAGFQNTLVQAIYDAILRFRGAPPAGAQ